MESKLIFMFQRLPIDIKLLVMEKVEKLLKISDPDIVISPYDVDCPFDGSETIH